MMNARKLVCTLILGGVLLPLVGNGQPWQEGVMIERGVGFRVPRTPPPFQNFAVAPSGPVRFLLSEQGKWLLRKSPHPKARALLGWMRADVSGLPESAPSELAPPPPSDAEPPSPQDAGSVVGCGTSAGTRFNLEPRTNARAQYTQAVDVFRNRVAAGIDLVVGGSFDVRGLAGLLGSSLTGYYVSRDTDCVPEFEGGLPSVADPLEPGDVLFGMGDPVVAADPARDAVFMADLRFDDSTTAIGVFRSPAATLLNGTACPTGTHTATQAATCWRTKRLVLVRVADFDGFFQDKPHLAVDERTSGTGAGNVYIAAIEFDFSSGVTGIKLVACTNTLASCSSPIVISTGDGLQFPHVAVRPDGQITLTWINVIDSFAPTYQILYRACTPAGAPAAPSCAATSLVHTETQPLPFGGFLAAQAFEVVTYPKHDHRVDANGTETYVVWDRCKVALIFARMCPDADVVMKASRNNGVTWSALTCVRCTAQDQFFSTIKTDRSRNIINIAFVGSGGDATFQHRLQVVLEHIQPGSATPDPVADLHTLTTLLNDPSGNPDPARLGRHPFFGDHIGVAARGTGTDGQSRAYVHYTYNNIQGVYNGVQVPELNNHLSRLDY
jgi:hypothetical protein